MFGCAALCVLNRPSGLQDEIATGALMGTGSIRAAGQAGFVNSTTRRHRIGNKVVVHNRRAHATRRTTDLQRLKVATAGADNLDVKTFIAFDQCVIDGGNIETGTRCASRDDDRRNTVVVASIGCRPRVTQVHHNSGLAGFAQAHGVRGAAAFDHTGAARDTHRHRGNGVHNGGGGTGGAGVDLLKVATAGRCDRGLQATGVFVNVFAVGAGHHQRPAGLAVLNQDRALVGHHGGVALRRRRQSRGEGIGGRAALCYPRAGAQVHRDWRDAVHNRCRGTGRANHEVLEVAAAG